MILYSIIIAVYNVDKYLEECLDSVVNQTYQNWEAILVDDGSKDQSGEICDRYVKADNRFKVYHRENQGSFMSRRFGMAQAKGDYILVIDSDDFINFKLLETANTVLDTNKYSMFIYKMKWGIDKDSRESQTVYPEGTVLFPKTNEHDRKKLWLNVLQSVNLNNLCLKIFSRKCLEMETDYEKYALLKSGTDMIQSLSVLDGADTIYFSEKAYYYYRQNTGGISDKKRKVKDKAGICKYFNDKKILTETKIEYAEKNTNLVKEILREYYSNNFISVVNVLADWYISVPKAQRRMITEVLVEQEYFSIYEGNIDADNMTIINRKIYEGILEADIKKIEFWMILPQIKSRVIQLMAVTS